MGEEGVVEMELVGELVWLARCRFVRWSDGDDVDWRCCRAACLTWAVDGGGSPWRASTCVLLWVVLRKSCSDRPSSVFILLRPSVNWMGMSELMFANVGVTRAQKNCTARSNSSGGYWPYTVLFFISRVLVTRCGEHTVPAIIARRLSNNNPCLAKL